MATYRGRPLGALGALGALSFHETKNVICGEGGALLVNDRALRRARRDPAGEGHEPQPLLPRPGRQVHVGRHRLVVPAERAQRRLSVGAAEQADEITARPAARSGTRYHDSVRGARGARAASGVPSCPADRVHNAHMYYLLLPTLEKRRSSSQPSRGGGVHAVFHYVPLHRSPAGRASAASGELPVTDDVADRFVRLPLWAGMGEEDVCRVIAAVEEAAQTASAV